MRFPFSSHIRFQEVHPMLTRLLFQNEPQKPITVTRSQTRQFVLLPIHLYTELMKLYQPNAHQLPLEVRLIGISAFHKGVLSFERACALFEPGESAKADALLILRHNTPVGALFLYPRYEALLAFLESRGVSGLEGFACDESQTTQTARTLPIAGAVQCFTDLPSQFAREQASAGVSLPVLVSKNNQTVLAIFPWVLCQSVMQELATKRVSEPLQALIAWWRVSQHGAEGEGPAHQNNPSLPEAHNWILCLKGDGFDLVEHFPYRPGDRVSVEARSVERDDIPCAALLVSFVSDDGNFGSKQQAFLRAFLRRATIFEMSESLGTLYHPSSSVSAEEG